MLTVQKAYCLGNSKSFQFVKCVTFFFFFFFLVKQVKCLLGGKRVHVHRHKGGLRESHTLVAVQITFMGYFCVTLTLKQVR